MTGNVLGIFTKTIGDQADGVVTPHAEPPVAPAPAVRKMIRLEARAPVLCFDGLHAEAEEQYRMIRTKIIQHPGHPRMIVVSSPGVGDGKTVSSINIATALALKRDLSVLLVDADMRRSQITRVLGLSDSPGLAGVLAGDCSLEEAVIRVEQFPSLQVLPGGTARVNPTELLDSARWVTVCHEFRRQFHFVVVDAPPIGAVADYDLIQVACDGLVLVMRPDHTDRTMCLTALERIPGQRLIGAVLNAVEIGFSAPYPDSYYRAREAQASCSQD